MSKMTKPQTAADEDFSFLKSEQSETQVQGVLRRALAYVHRNGMCEFIEGPGLDDVRRVTVCGFSVNDDPPCKAVHKAAHALLCEVARGTDCEADYFGLAYEEVLESVMIYMDSCSFDDAQACAFLEAAYHRGGRSDNSFARPGEWNAPAIIVLN
jgi:hypothetical protein